MRAERWTLAKSRTLHSGPGTRLLFSTNETHYLLLLLLLLLLPPLLSTLPLRITSSLQRTSAAERTPTDPRRHRTDLNLDPSLDTRPFPRHPSGSRSRVTYWNLSRSRKEEKTMQKRTRGGLFCKSFSFPFSALYQESAKTEEKSLTIRSPWRRCVCV